VLKQMEVTAEEIARREEGDCLDFDVMIVGAQKSGTSTLLTHLLCGAGVSPLHRPEVAYFTDDEEFGRGAAVVRQKYFGPGAAPSSLRIGKDIRLLGSPEGISRLLADSPRVRMVAVLREPVGRAYSSYWFARRRGFEPEKSFERAVERELAGRHLDLPRQDLRDYVRAGEYATHLEALFELVERSRVRVLCLEELHAEPRQIANEILASFGTAIPEGVSPPPRANASARARSERAARFFGSPQLRRLVRPAVPAKMRGAIERAIRRANDVPFKPPPMEQAVRERLATHYEPQIERLSALIGRDLDGWKQG